MTDYSPRPRWWLVLGAVLLMLATGAVAYNIGLSHGASATVALAQPAPGTGAPAAPVPYPYGYPYGWHRPWGFGFFPFFLLLLLFLFFRGACWGWGGPRRRWYYEDREPNGERTAADDTRR